MLTRYDGIMAVPSRWVEVFSCCWTNLLSGIGQGRSCAASQNGPGKLFVTRQSNVTKITHSIHFVGATHHWMRLASSTDVVNYYVHSVLCMFIVINGSSTMANLIFVKVRFLEYIRSYILYAITQVGKLLTLKLCTSSSRGRGGSTRMKP